MPIAANEISLRVPRTNERRPDARYTTNLIVDNVAESCYHAGQLEFETGLVRDFQGRVTYTFSKALDTGSEATASGAGDINIFPPEYEDYKRGLSRFDTRHRVTATAATCCRSSAIVKDSLGAVLGGWQLVDGRPPRLGNAVHDRRHRRASDIDFDGVANQRPVVVDPKYAGGWHVNDPIKSQQKMPVSAFRRAVPGDDVNDLIGRNTYFTDGREQIDLGLSKSFTPSAARTASSVSTCST